MEIYYLCPEGEKPFRPLSNPDGGSRVVRPDGSSPKSWARARQKAVEHCASLPGRGTTYCMIVVGHVDVRLVRRKDWSKPGYPEVFWPVEPEDRHDHAIIGYVERLLEQYAAAVYVPPMGEVRNLPHTWAEHYLTLPMVAAYRSDAAMTVNMAGFSSGYELSSRGYGVITLGDCGYFQHGPTVYEEEGSTKKWRRAHAETLEELLGVRPRD